MVDLRRPASTSVRPYASLTHRAIASWLTPSMPIAIRLPRACVAKLILFAAALALSTCVPSQIPASSPGPTPSRLTMVRPEPTPSLDGTWAISRYESPHPLRGETGIAPLLAMSVTFEIRGPQVTLGSALDAHRDVGAARGAWLATIERTGSSIALAAVPGSEFSWLFDRRRGSVGPDRLVWEAPGARVTVVRASALPRPPTLCTSREVRVFELRARCRADEHAVE